MNLALGRNHSVQFVLSQADGLDSHDCWYLSLGQSPLSTIVARESPRSAIVAKRIEALLILHVICYPTFALYIDLYFTLDMTVF